MSRLLFALAFCIGLVAWGEPVSTPEQPVATSADAERAVRWLFSRWKPWVAESNPTQWTKELWQTGGLTPQDWEAAIQDWEKNPKVADALKRGEAYREQYLREKTEAAQKLLTPEGTRPPALERTVKDYMAFLQSQKHRAVGPPTMQQADQFGRQAVKPIQDLIDAGVNDPFLNDLLKRNFSRAVRKAEESDFPSTNKSAREEQWIAWRERNRKVAESEIIERFKQAVAIGQSETKLKFWAGGKRIRPTRLAALKLKVDWKEGTIVTDAGKPLTFKGDGRVVHTLSEFIKDAPPAPAGEIRPKKDVGYTAVHRLQSEARGIQGAVQRFDKTSHEEAMERVLARLQTSSRTLQTSLADPLSRSATPFAQLAHTPGSASDGAIEAMLWDGFRRSPRHFQKRDGFLRIAFPLEQVVKKGLVSENLRKRLGKILLWGVLLTGGIDQAYENRELLANLAMRALEPVAERVVPVAQPAVTYVADHIDTEAAKKYLPAKVVEWLEAQQGDARQSRTSEGEGAGQPQSGGSESSDAKPPEKLKLPDKTPPENDRVGSSKNAFYPTHKPGNFEVTHNPLTVATRGFSSEPTHSYQGEIDALPPGWLHSGDKLSVEPTRPFETENGKLLIPHSEGFLLTDVKLRLAEKGSRAAIFPIVSANPERFPLTRSEMGYYVVDLNAEPGLAEKYETGAVEFTAEYVALPRADYLQRELAITDPKKVEELADHFAKAGFGRIAEGLREEAKGMTELGYSLYPEDVAKRIEMGSLYSEVKNPPSGITLDSGNLFAGLANLAFEEHLCGQCTGSAEVTERSLKFLYEGKKGISIRQRTVSTGNDSNHWTVPYHAQVEVHGSGPTVVVDATARTKDPRNWERQVPQDDVLRSAGQQDPFAPEKLPDLSPPEAEKTEAEKKDREAKPRLFISAGNYRNETLFQKFVRGLMELPPGDHKFRFRGELPGEADEQERERLRLELERRKLELAKPKPPHPQVLAQLAKLELARKELLDDHSFRKLNVRVREQIKALPFSNLYRAYLLGEISREQFREKLLPYLPSDSELRKLPNPSTQALLKEAAAQQRKIYDRVIAAAAGPATPTLKSVANPVLTDKVVGIFDQMAKFDADPLVDPNYRRALLTRVTGCLGYFNFLRTAQRN